MSIVNGRKVTDYDPATPDEVRQILELYMGDREVRLRIHTGNTPATVKYAEIAGSDTTIGRDWMEEYDVEGYISRTMGAGPNPVHSPLIVHNARSLGGMIIGTAGIVRIRIAGKHGRDLYRHPGYHLDPAAAVNPYDDRMLDRNWPGWRDDERFAAAIMAARAERERACIQTRA